MVTCIDCGIKTDYRSKRCRSCAGKETARKLNLSERWKRGESPTWKGGITKTKGHCLTCNEEIDRRSLRCTKCCRIGKLHPAWKGGKYKSSDGYVMVYSPQHPYKDSDGYVREHRLAMEKKLNRYLNSEEIVHHINEDKEDNQEKNLQLTNKSEHSTLHRRKSFIKD